jgi:AraC family transcriptional regulator of adaptative response/methylated-DNA-[protein]-cysteine methyltransferase
MTAITAIEFTSRTKRGAMETSHGPRPTPSSDDFLSQAARWQAVTRRDSRADGRFLYGVRSTSIYCRPSCPARRPAGVDRVVFFTNAEEAEAAGYRACRRCAPREQTIGLEDASLVTALCRYIETHAERAPSMTELAEQAQVSPHQLGRLFRKVLGLSPKEYAATCRLARFKQELRSGEPISLATYSAGFGSSSRVYESTDSTLGMTPLTYQKGGAGKRVAYTFADSPLGRLLVAATERGVCKVSLGDDDAALRTELEHEFHSASLERDDAALREYVDEILAGLDGRSLLDVPLDVRATAFQRRVWRALQAIPFGVTRSYAEVAASIGKPSAVRAVARACATNPVSLVVPCHRVVRSDGGLGGYRWGIERKRALLERESQRSESNGD